MYLFVNNIDRTTNLINNTIRISDELQERINRASFTLAGFNPSDFDDVRIFEGFPIVSTTSNSVTLQKSFNEATQNNLFRIGDPLTVALGETDEETNDIVSISNDGGNIKVTIIGTFLNTPVALERAGILKFAGNVIDNKDSNQTTLNNITFNINCLDYTRIFDKELINDTFVAKDARYIVNDFCNKFINNNIEIDEFNYLTNTEIRTQWIESGDGNNPSVDLSDLREGLSSGIFDWTNSSGTASFVSNFIAGNFSELTGVTSGAPTKGLIGFWYKTTDFSVITDIEFRFGSDTSNYISFTFTPTDDEWNFLDTSDLTVTVVGTPDWTITDYFEFIITQTGTSSIHIDGLRFLEEEFFRHFPFVQESVVFADFRLGRVKPTETMQRLAEELGWFWYIDYNRNIRLFPEATNFAPIDITEISNNFKDLSIKSDISRLLNRQVVRGGDETSIDTYSQVVEGDGVVREWILKNKFKNLIVKLDDGTITDLTEAGTTTTLVNAIGHGLIVGDFMVNRTAGNEVREVLTVPDLDSFTVAVVAGQTTGDTFSVFVIQNVGIEGIDAELTFDFMSNFNEKSIRNSEIEDTLAIGDFLLFTYNEVFPILAQRTDNVSVTNMKNKLGYTDGIFDGQPITDRTLKTRSEATQVAEAQLNKYSNVVISATFQTYQEGLQTGQLIRVKDTTSSERNIDQNFIIQSVRHRQVAWGENSYTITCSSLLFGMMELLQQLLAQNRKIEVDEDEIINNIEDGFEIISILDTINTDIDGEKQSETIIISDSEISEIKEPPFKWGPVLADGDLLLEDGTGLLLEDGDSLAIDTPGGPKMIWNLSSWF